MTTNTKTPATSPRDPLHAAGEHVEGRLAQEISPFPEGGSPLGQAANDAVPCEVCEVAIVSRLDRICDGCKDDQDLEAMAEREAEADRDDWRVA